MNKLEEVISPGYLKPNSVYLFTNCMHFMANWKHPFNIVATQTFTDNALEEIKVEMMMTDPVEVSVAFTKRGEIIELPLYEEFGDFGFFVVRPEADNTVEMEKELQEHEFQNFLEA